MKKKTAAAVATVLVLRTCNAELKAHNNFQWPESGEISAPDFRAEPVCGYGLHGLKWGQGDGGLLDWSPEAKWLVVAVPEDSIVELDGKVKFPKGEVVYCGNREGATKLIAAEHAGPIVGLTVQTDHQNSVVCTGYRGTATAGNYGTATAGEGGTATAGNYGTATAGEGGTATAGEGGTVEIKFWDGKRYRRVVGYVGEDGIKADTAYRGLGSKLVEVVK